jgi:hypothetical protein
MVRRCMILNCPNRTKNRNPTSQVAPTSLSPKFHLFPTKKKLELWKLWLEKTFGDDVPTVNVDHFAVCERHFRPRDYKRWSEASGESFVKRGRLVDDAVPTLHLHDSYSGLQSNCSALTDVNSLVWFCFK